MEYWVLNAAVNPAEVEVKDGKMKLSNGLISREISIADSKTISFCNLQKNIELVDTQFTDVFVTISGRKIPLSEGFTFTKIKSCNCLKRLDYKKIPTMTDDSPYPPAGKATELIYDNEKSGLRLRVHYEIYDGMPVLMKTVWLENNSKEKLVVDNISVDVLKISKNRDTFFVDSDFNAATDCLGLDFEKYAKHYARYQYDTLEVAPEFRMNVKLVPGESLQSIVSYEMCFGTDYYEQRLIEVKTMHRRIAPWCSDNTTFFHLISKSSSAIKKAVDECAEIGIEMIIQSFGSGVNMESHRDSYLERIRKAYDYGHKKGIRMGAYTLAYVKNYRPVRGDEALNHDGSHICRCLANEWSQKYTRDVLNFIDRTNADAVEIDGPYGMLLCSGGKTHLHDDFTDSQYRQWKLAVVDWYTEFKKRNVYINAPDCHFLCGSNRSGVGYEEIAFSENRMEQLITSRIYYYKGTFDKNPSQCWGFLPLNVYHGGGKDATFFPTEKNSFEFDWALAQLTASGVWPTIRGKKVYDSEKGKEIFKKWVSIYKKYRQVLNGVTVHFMPPRIDTDNPRRTTGIDAIMNQLPSGDERGFLMLFNQSDNEITQEITIPVYYTGLTDLQCPPPPFENTKNSDVSYPIYGEEIAPLVIKARDGSTRKYITDTPVEDKEIPALKKAQPTEKTIVMSEEDKAPKVYKIDTNGNIKLNITLPAMSYKWFVLKENK